MYTGNFVREFITFLRYKDKKTYKITWPDVEYLFRDSIDPLVSGIRSIWDSDKKIEWLVDNLSDNLESDYTIEDFVVHVARCQFDDGTYAHLSIGGGGEHQSRNAYISFTDTLRGSSWKCNICIDRVSDVNPRNSPKWQAGTIRIGNDRERGEHIKSIHMKSAEDHKVSEMSFNANFRNPSFLSSRHSKKGNSVVGFNWDDDMDTVWEECTDRHHLQGNTYYTINKDWWSDFKDDIISFENDIFDMNPQNKCSNGVFDIDGNKLIRY